MDILSILKKSKIYKAIKNLFTKSKDKLVTQNSKDNLTGSIIFDIIDNRDIRIQCYFPDIEKMNDGELIENAENYGRLLSNITDGVYAQKIADILLSSSDVDDPKTVLFVNNIISFWSAFHIDNHKKEIRNSNQPLVRPSRVFRRS
jgi:hypothetical protein